MRRWVKWTAGAVAGLLAVAAGAVAVGLALGASKAQRQWQVDVKAPALRTDAQAIERGRYLYASRGCADCHGAQGAGRTFVNEAGLLLHGPNITTGPGGVVAAYGAADWARTIRHGVAPSGRPLRVMPSEDYSRLTDTDLASVVAYVRSLAPAAGTGARIELPLPARVLYGYGLLRDAAEKIDHSLPPATPVAEGVNLAHGAYVAQMCVGCHGAQLVGGRIPGAPPDWPPASNLTPGADSAMARYPTAESMQAMFRSGKRPDGSAIRVMPFEALREINDVDVRALHLYLAGLRKP